MSKKVFCDICGEEAYSCEAINIDTRTYDVCYSCRRKVQNIIPNILKLDNAIKYLDYKKKLELLEKCIQSKRDSIDVRIKANEDYTNLAISLGELAKEYNELKIEFNDFIKEHPIQL